MVVEKAKLSNHSRKIIWGNRNHKHSDLNTALHIAKKRVYDGKKQYLNTAESTGERKSKHSEQTAGERETEKGKQNQAGDMKEWKREIKGMEIWGWGK